MSEKTNTVIELTFKEWLRKEGICFIPKLEDQLLSFIKETVASFRNESVLESSMHRLVRALGILDQKEHHNVYEILESIITDISNDLKKSG